ncbi:MAG: DUF2721 domain-containing protein [Thermoflexales bacterium]|nr:DUF2721 domain-containing protein [Thermoflexales bacterium]
MQNELTLTTPALLFPAISLLLLAFTNRFLTLANLTRELYARFQARPDVKVRGQLRNLRYRMTLIRNMQFLGIASFFACVLCMFLIFAGLGDFGRIIFGLALALLLGALAISMREIQVSIDALNLQIDDVDRIAIPGAEGS